jgi:ABC-2 type transport system permease protein
MIAPFFVETLRRSWRTAVYWGLGIALMGIYMVIIVPDAEAMQRYTELFQALPPTLLQVFGITDTEILTSLEGFIAFGYFGYVPLFLTVFAVHAGMQISANEEDTGTLDIVLSLPANRSRVIIERFAAWSVLTILILVIGFGGLLLGVSTSTVPIDLGKLIVSSINMLPSVLLMIAFTVFCGTLIRRRGVVLGAAVAFIAASYAINVLGSAASETLLAVLQGLSFFYYYDGEYVIQNGLHAGNLTVLVAANIGLLIAALWFFRQRDIGV